MKIKTAKLTGKALALAVAKADEWEPPEPPSTCRDCPHLDERGITDGSEWTCRAGELQWNNAGFWSHTPFGDDIGVEYGVHQLCPLRLQPPTAPDYLHDRALCWDIMEREGISLRLSEGHPPMAFIWRNDAQFDFKMFGPDPEHAVLRCFVCSKLGAEVDVPEELLKE